MKLFLTLLLVSFLLVPAVQAEPVAITVEISAEDEALLSTAFAVKEEQTETRTAPFNLVNVETNSIVKAGSTYTVKVPILRPATRAEIQAKLATFIKQTIQQMVLRRVQENAVKTYNESLLTK